MFPCKKNLGKNVYGTLDRTTCTIDIIMNTNENLDLFTYFKICNKNFIILFRGKNYFSNQALRLENLTLTAHAKHVTMPCYVL